MKRDVSFLLLSGGVGSRSGHNEPKQFRRIRHLEMMAYSLKVANNHPRISEIVTNAPDGYLERTQVLCERHAPSKTLRILECGQTRQASVKLLVEAARHETVILHEAARPLIDSKMIDELLASDAENVGLFAAIPFSMCEIDLDKGLVLNNIPRKQVFNIQLPQKFKRSTLLSAHEFATTNGVSFTEDAVMVKETLGCDVKAIAGHVKNIKVTTPEDFGIVTRLMEEEVTI